MTMQTISIADQELVVLTRKDFDDLMEKAWVLPPRVKPDKNGNVDARQSVDIHIARSLITERIKHGWTQTELARRCGVRLETIGRIEAGKHIPRQETLIKIDHALSGS